MRRSNRAFPDGSQTDFRCHLIEEVLPRCSGHRPPGGWPREKQQYNSHLRLSSKRGALRSQPPRAGASRAEASATPPPSIMCCCALPSRGLLLSWTQRNDCCTLKCFGCSTIVERTRNTHGADTLGSRKFDHGSEVLLELPRRRLLSCD